MGNFDKGWDAFGFSATVELRGSTSGSIISASCSGGSRVSGSVLASCGLGNLFRACPERFVVGEAGFVFGNVRAAFRESGEGRKRGFTLCSIGGNAEEGASWVISV